MFGLATIAAALSLAVANADAAAAPPPGPYDHLVATGSAKRLLAIGRRQLGVRYVYGAQPRDPAGLRALRGRARSGFDCSSYVAWLYQRATGAWISGSVAHTDQIWTQGGQLPLDESPGETDLVVRGTGAAPPPGGYRPGDILLRHAGSGGYWGHVAVVAEHGMVLESYPPNVHDDTPIETFLADGDQLGWVRVRDVAANSPPATA